MKRILIACMTIVCLLACGEAWNSSDMSKEEARAVMDDVSRRNLAYEPLTERDDTLMQRVVAYYLKHGTANELMEAYYLLGSVYRDLHEAPRAMDAFLHSRMFCLTSILHNLAIVKVLYVMSRLSIPPAKTSCRAFFCLLFYLQ